MQSKKERQYWAERRKAEGRVKQPKKPARKPVLLASSVEEYDDIRKIHPNMPVRLDRSKETQLPLFDSREFKDD